MGLYGYHRPTTPRMEMQRNELDVYSDVVTPETHTITVMQKVLTFANHNHPEYYHEKASVVELFNAAGFETYWISNQAYITVSYGAISRQSKHVYDFNLVGQPDGILLPSLKNALNDSIKGNKAIFIHLMGNHYKYNMRYPASFNHFDYKKDGDLADLDFRDDEAKKIIDEYDNSILYGDFIYDSILKELKALDVSSWFLFFSDHGEEVYDTRKISGHHLSNVYPCQSRVPFVLWRSEKYRQEKPELIIDTDRSYSTEDVIYSISTLSGLEYEGNTPSYSLFSSEYVAPEVRWVGEEDYENILKKQ
jgi:heptose-I-phosphate ethanolaminephosphotransferase